MQWSTGLDKVLEKVDEAAVEVGERAADIGEGVAAALTEAREVLQRMRRALKNDPDDIPDAPTGT